MITPMLLEVARSAPSLRQRITAFKRSRGILTHCGPALCTDDWERWLALIPFDEDKDKNIGECMADHCRLYEDSGYCATAKGELSVIRKLCCQLGIHCDL